MASVLDKIDVLGRSDEALKVTESFSDCEKEADIVQVENGQVSLEDADLKGTPHSDSFLVQLPVTDTDNIDPAYSALPQLVRELCDFEDDPHMPVLTWR